MKPPQSLIRSAARLEGEPEQLRFVLENFADHSRKRAYADWLTTQKDSRGLFLRSILDDWDAGKTALAADESFDTVWRDTSGVTLLQKLREGALDAQAAAICSAARPALKLMPARTKSDVPVGATKFGGKPDLNETTEWPEFDGKLQIFLGQFRLDDLRETQAGRLLPGSGLLSFFVFDDCVESGMVAAGRAEGACRVIYTPDVSRLRRLDSPKAFDDENRLAVEHLVQIEETLDLPYVSVYGLDTAECDRWIGGRRAKSLGLTEKLGDAYEAVLDALLPEREGRSHFLGWSHPQVLADDPVEEEHRHLLTLASDDELGWCWADGHQLFFSTQPDDLAAGRFDRTTVTDG